MIRARIAFACALLLISGNMSAHAQTDPAAPAPAPVDDDSTLDE